MENKKQTKKTTPEDIVAHISKELESKEENKAQERIIIPHEEVSFDINALSVEQLQMLKAKLNVTPERSVMKKENPQVFLRRINGRFVVDFKNAYLGLVKDYELNREVERHIIPVLLQGDTEYTNILYSDWINAERVPCEVIDHRTKIEEIEEGETRSRETGGIVTMIRKVMFSYFTVKLPNGETLEIEGKLANA